MPMLVHDINDLLKCVAIGTSAAPGASSDQASHSCAIPCVELCPRRR